MLKLSGRVASAVAVLGLVVMLAPAQPTGKEGPNGTVRAKSILGAKVALQGDASGGTVEDIVLSHEGVVDYLIVSEGGKLVTVPWDAVKFNYDKRIAVIDIPVEKYRQIPTYTVEQYPNYYAPAYRTQVYKYYGLTPGQERRLERRVNK